MERSAQLRRSKSASRYEEHRQIPKYRTLSRLSPDYDAYIRGSTRDDMFMVERGQSSSAQATGRPMPYNFMVEKGQSSSAPATERPMPKPFQFKMERGESSSRRATEKPMAKVLAEKMFKEIEPKSRSMSAIARLMRLEGLHSLWKVSKQKRRSSDDYRQNDVLIKFERNKQLYDGQYDRRSPMKEPQFSEVYEDASGFVNPRRSSKWSVRSMPTKSEMGLIRKKLDTKRLFDDESSDERLENLKELDETLDMLDSRDLLMKYIRKRDAMFANERLILSSSSKPSDSAKYRRSAKAWIPDRDTTGTYRISSHPERCDGLLLEPHYRHRARSFPKISNAELEEKMKKGMLPTQIYVLKPKLGNMPSADVRGSSSHHSLVQNSDFRRMKEYQGAGGADETSWRRNDQYYNAEISKSKYDGARKLAREITRKIRDAYENGDGMYSGLGEYVGVEGLYDAHRSDFNNEPEMSKGSSRKPPVDDNNWGRYPEDRFHDRKGKKKLIERWNETQNYRDLELVRYPGTLGEVLAIPDGDTRPDARSGTRRGINNGSPILGDPSGITSRGGPKNETKSTSSRSKSLPPIGGRNHRSHDVFTEENLSDPITCGKGKAVKGYPIPKNFHVSPGSKSKGKKPITCPPIHIKELESSLEATFEMQREANVEDLPEPQHSSQMAEKDDCDGGPVTDIIVDKQVTFPSESSQLHPKQSSMDAESSAARDQRNFRLQGLHEGADEDAGSPSLNDEVEHVVHVASETLKNDGYGSPISVFEVPYPEEGSPSSSESFARISSELNELQMKQQLLKLLKLLEHGPYDEISSLITMRTEIAHSSSSTAESWEVSYTLDVLIHSGFQDSGFDMSMFNYPDNPLDPVLFHTLEEEYGNDAGELRSERRLLFDRINSALIQFSQKQVDLCPWLMPKLAPTWASDDHHELIGLDSANRLVTECVVLRDMQWSVPTKEIALIGEEIEKLLLDDLINELLCE